MNYSHSHNIDSNMSVPTTNTSTSVNPMKILILNYRDDSANHVQQILDLTRDYATVTVKTRLPYSQIAVCLQEVQPNVVQLISRSLRDCRFLMTNDQGKDDAMDYDDIMDPFQKYVELTGQKVNLFYAPTGLSCVMGSRFYYHDLAKISLSFGLLDDKNPDSYCQVSQCLYAGLKNGLTARNIRETLKTGLDKAIRQECYLFGSINKIKFHELV